VLIVVDLLEIGLPFSRCSLSEIACLKISRLVLAEIYAAQLRLLIALDFHSLLKELHSIPRVSLVVLVIHSCLPKLKPSFS